MRWYLRLRRNGTHSPRLRNRRAIRRRHKNRRGLGLGRRNERRHIRSAEGLGGFPVFERGQCVLEVAHRWGSGRSRLRDRDRDKDGCRRQPHPAAIELSDECEELVDLFRSRTLILG
jgi:hypothetical protein